MPPPTVNSWLMEELLVPYKHYLPVLPDWSDLEEKVTWCLQNEEHCQNIGLAGRCWMMNFLDLERERDISKEVLKRTHKVQQNRELCRKDDNI